MTDNRHLKGEQPMEQEYQKVILEKLHYQLDQLVDYEILNKNNLHFDVQMDRVSRNMMLRLHLDIWSEKLQTDEHEVTYPYTWWDHFKRDAIPTFTRWFKLKIKHQHKRIKFNRKAIFPKFNQYSHGPTAEFIIHENVDFFLD